MRQFLFCALILSLSFSAFSSEEYVGEVRCSLKSKEGTVEGKMKVLNHGMSGGVDGGQYAMILTSAGSQKVDCFILGYNMLNHTTLKYEPQEMFQDLETHNNSDEIFARQAAHQKSSNEVSGWKRGEKYTCSCAYEIF